MRAWKNCEVKTWELDYIKLDMRSLKTCEMNHELVMY
jgi:hypothetical protein